MNPPARKSKKKTASKRKTAPNGKPRASASRATGARKQAAAGTRRPPQAESSKSAGRFAGEPRVFRFWQDPSGFLVYAAGLWRGDGVHGDPDKDGEYKWMRARFGADGLEMQVVTSLPRPPARGLKGLLLRKKLIPQNEEKTETLHFPATSCEADVDLARWRNETRQVEVQAIDGERQYLLMRALGDAGRIEFAGSLQRTH